MSGGALDILDTTRELEAAGIERAQAEAIAQAIGRIDDRHSTTTAFERLESLIATKADKADLQRLEALVAIKADKADIEKLELLIATKADKADLERLEALVATKADKADIERLDAQMATKTDLANIRADVYRALWIQGAGIVAIVSALQFLR